MSHQTLIVGAGLAGLSAARELVRAGKDVQVIEARERVGGRVHTIEFSGGQYGDLGAEFVDNRHAAIIAYAKEFDLKLDQAAQFPDDLHWYINGVLSNRKSLTVEQETALDKLYAKLQTLRDRQEDPQQTLNDWLDTNQIPLFARQIARIIARSLFATDPELIGVGFFAYSGFDQEGSSMRIRGGSARLVEALAKDLGNRVRTGSPVRRIQQTENSVILSVETANGLVEVVAQNAILTLPWSVLRHIPMEVPMSNSQREAIFSLPYGGLVKTLLQYPYQFWSRTNFGVLLLDGNYQAIWEPTFAQKGTEKILSCFSGGLRSLELSEQAVNQASSAVRSIYPNAPNAITSGSHNWDADEWSKGAYCYFRPGDLKRLEPHLTQLSDHIFLAGEHTAPLEYRGYMEGAVQSGQRAAKQILQWQNN
ncbi:MAG: NAD(P)/FAD-dependent oxidoreductase [Scytonema sp. PMC 1069.18]|nr:NAD(P)/FAD-dependent oxidoreductase [Scytonema sp. PMC 1069.18]MEC4882644.1 NAD(P)/FAD-dependent oxidoreductase [Scytonema sp. PMC 1070.18]